jgi:NADH-quinone oxidoreductase subunit G
MKEILTNCSFCSLACPVVIRGGQRGPLFGEGSFLSLEWDTRDDSKYNGSLCARGNAIVEFLTHQKRLNYPFVLGERTTFDAAVKEAARNLLAIKEESGGGSIGILLGDSLTNEEAALAVTFAREVLGTDNVALFAPDDVPIFRAYLGCDLSSLKPTGPKPPGDREVSLLIGDPMTEHPCVAKDILPSKYGTRGSEVIVISPERNHSAWFANRHLRCKPGGEAAVLLGLLKAAGESSGVKLEGGLASLLNGVDWNVIDRIGGINRDAIEGAATSILGAVRVRTYVSNLFGRIGAPALAGLFAEALTRICPGESTYEPQFVQQNTWGIYSVLAGAGNGKVLERLDGAEIKALILLGLDLFSVYPAAPVEKALREKKFSVTTQFFWNQTASRANVVLPAAGLIEKRGTVSPSFGEDLVREETVTPLGGTCTDEEFLIALAGEMGVDLSPVTGIEGRTEGRGSCEGIKEDWDAYVEAAAALDAAETVLIPWSDPVHAADGSLSRYFHWSEITCPEPKLMISNDYADELKLKNGNRITVKSDGGELVLPVARTEKLSGKVVGATIHFPSVRKLFPWKLDGRHGEIDLAPVPVQLGRQQEKA